ncbi:unnamed protein product [Rhizoctonia solani]|uniref:Uncharacterized protein n=1 Tax=Rhizoctonia solani TaxID=456999 RepID=A0A8H2WIS6_9AGAM|nr:unnamed protein product [Rhizoctonia solani]
MPGVSELSSNILQLITFALLSNMHFKSVIIGTLFASAQAASAASLLTPRGDDQCRRAQIYGCTVDAQEMTSPVDARIPIYTSNSNGRGYTGVCYKTTGLFRDGLASARSKYSTGAVMFANGDCTGDFLWLDTQGQSNVNTKQYQSYVGIFIPEYS